jgi:hypothetical protein
MKRGVLPFLAQLLLAPAAFADETGAPPAPAPEATPTSAQPAEAVLVAPLRPAPEKSLDRYRLNVGGHLGVTHPVGISAIAMKLEQGRPWLDADVTWEPSRYLQSYGLGAAIHPFHNSFYTGGRARLLQLHAPWSRGFHAAMDNQFGLSIEAGVRKPFGEAERFLFTGSVGVTHVLDAGTSIAWMQTLTLGLSYAVLP